MLTLVKQKQPFAKIKFMINKHVHTQMKTYYRMLFSHIIHPQKQYLHKKPATQMIDFPRTERLARAGGIL